MQQWYNCPRCRQYIQWGIPQCNYCGCPINWGPPPPPTQQMPPQQPTRINKQQYAQPGVIQCPHCGKMINTAVQQPANQKTRINLQAGQQTRVQPPMRPQPGSAPKKNPILTVLIVLCVLGILACAVYIIYPSVFSSGLNFLKHTNTIQTNTNTSSQTQAAGTSTPQTQATGTDTTQTQTSGPQSGQGGPPSQ